MGCVEFFFRNNLLKKPFYQSLQNQVAAIDE